MSSTLLLADDSVTIQRVIELTFSHEDVRVVSVSDGHRAMQWLEGEWPDIVLADVGVPGVDGYALAAHIRSSPRLSQVPVLLLAGAFEPVDRARVQQAGCDGVLIKPFEPQQLVSVVKDLLAKRQSAGPAGPPSNASVPGSETWDRRAAQAVGVPEPEPAHVMPFPGPARPGEMAARSVHASFDPMGGNPEPLEPPTRPVWELGLPAPAAAPLSPAPAAPKVSLVSAFSALLAAEQSSQPAMPAPGAAPITEATVEDAVRRVLVRMTDELVRRIVLETAERLIREEIEKIKATPD
ncbi:MAG: response regulator [Vicinamibacterales bacterium]